MAVSKTGTFLGSVIGHGQLLNPTALAFGPDPNLYVADFEGGNIVRYDLQTGGVETFLPAGMGVPFDLAFCPNPGSEAPEPGSLLLLGLGGVGLLAYRGWKRPATRRGIDASSGL